MISNEHHWATFYQRSAQSYSSPAQSRNYQPASQGFRQGSPENNLKSCRLQIERKCFLVMLKENSRGRFLRICEDMGNRSASIIIPEEGFASFVEALGKMVAADREIPAKEHPDLSAQPTPPTPP